MNRCGITRKFICCWSRCPRGAGLFSPPHVRRIHSIRIFKGLCWRISAKKIHLGVLTGSPITDMKLTLVAGRASLHHTEGGDFRQATYRAVRQGLMCAQSILLEPFYSFRLELPRENLGRAINDIRGMGGSFSAPEEGDDGESCAFCGTAPVSAMRGYTRELAAYTRGRGRLGCEFSHYGNAEMPKA